MDFEHVDHSFLANLLRKKEEPLDIIVVQNYILSLGSVCFRKRQFPLVAKRHIKMNYFLLLIMKNLLFSLIYFLSI